MDIASYKVAYKLAIMDNTVVASSRPPPVLQPLLAPGEDTVELYLIYW